MNAESLTDQDAEEGEHPNNHRDEGMACLTVAGVDGRRGGWAVAVLRASTSVHRHSVDRWSVNWHSVTGQDAEGFRAVLALARAEGAVAVGVDCPIGLPAAGHRACDLQARALLGRAGARVFLAPPRAVLAAPDYATARAVARALPGGHGVSAQAYGIRRIVTAVDAVLRDRPLYRPGDGTAPDPVVEVHPELSFRAMTSPAAGPALKTVQDGAGPPTGGTVPPRGALPAKRTPEGRRARLDALAGLPGLDALATTGGTDPAPPGDDHLDAAAAAWSALRWVTGAAHVLGGAVDGHGLPMRIVV